MSDAAVMAIGLVVGLAVMVLAGLLYRWRRRKSIAGRGLAVVLLPSDEWTDADVDRLLAELESPDEDEYEEEPN